VRQIQLVKPGIEMSHPPPAVELLNHGALCER